MRANEIEELMQHGDVPGLSIAVIREGQIVWKQPFGQKNAILNGTTDGPVREDTLFPAASLSKPVFAYIALRLVDRGILDLDKPLYEYLPYPRLEHDERYKRITARLVLSHATGLPNWGGTPLNLLFTPGERFRYSGEGIMYLQAVVEKLTCQSLEGLAQQEVFGPLRMIHSTYVWSPALAVDLVSGYRGVEDPQIVNDPKASSAGSLLTTSNDYARFVLAIIEGTGLKNETAEQMLTPQIHAPRDHVPSGVSWGLGWGLEESDSGPYFWHWGDNYGFKCFVIASREKRQGVVYFTNTQEGLSIATALVTLTLGGKHPSLAWLGYDQYDAPTVVARKELLRAFEQQGTEAGLARYRELHQESPAIVDEDFTVDFGCYLRGHEKRDAAIAVFKENLRSYPQSANTYDSLSWAYVFADKVELAVENMEKAYELEPNEEPNGTQRKSQIAWMREYLKLQTEVANVLVETLRRYVGSYKERRVTLREGSLYCEDTASDQPRRLLPLSETTFGVEGDVRVRLRFVTGQGDKADKIVLSYIENRQEEAARDSCDASHGRVERNDRHVKLDDFEDGGLTAGLRAIQIYLPAGYDESADRYPVVYFSDGGNAFSRPGATMDVDLAYDRLIDEGLIHPTIFVGIGIAGREGRLKDLQPAGDGGGGGVEGYYRFIAKWLKPFIDHHYRTRPEPASTGIAGYSLGGSSAFWMAYTHPETFGMAGCMSWDHEYARQPLRDDPGGKKPVRFWLDGGGGEYETWRNATQVYCLLEQKGWLPGDDLAAYFDYHADHKFEAGAGRMREMLYFLLRKEPLRLETYRLVYAVDPSAATMDLSTGRRPIVGAEAWYANGLRLTVPQPGLIVADTDVATVDADDPLRLHAVGPGETTISSTCQGRCASLTVIGYDPEAPRRCFDCPPADAAPGTETDLPHAILDDDQTSVARFGVSCDTRHVHIVVQVRDSTIIAEPGKAAGEQDDGIVIWFDARPEPDLRGGGGTHDDFLLFAMNPGPPGEHISMYYPESVTWGRVLPDGTEATCVLDPGGYLATLSIPTHYLDTKQGAPWNVFRLNIRVYDIDKPGGQERIALWQPYWLTFQSPIGTGIFTRGGASGDGNG